MSKLAKAIDATTTGNVREARDLKLNYLDITEETSIVSHYSLDKQYRIGVAFRQTIYISERDNFSDAVLAVKRAMIEEVFGEFRPYIIEMQSALYVEDRARIRTLLAELENKMFADGL